MLSREKKFYSEKTIRKIETANGDIITNQADILKEIEIFYSNLYRSRDNLLPDMDLYKLFENQNINKLNNEEYHDIGKLLTVDELAKTLKSMKNNKTPGIDGFPAEFFKIFWCKLKFLITRALNHCFLKGELSATLRHAVITCIPKGNKPRNLLKNWRPISLLSVLYKLISGTIASRTKSCLQNLISHTQTGFIKGRYIGESTRLVYDIMEYVENNKKPGLLMLIDFEKAFDSISWKFMYNVLQFLGFPPDYINWVKLMNKNFTASVIQAGVKSSPILIARGCKQGDPIASYLFILCGQILTYLLEFDCIFKGIKIGKKEFKLSQFADDTTIFLDGSQESLQAALNIIETFGSFSGLKMNKTKTKVIWIGKRKHTKDKLSVNATLDWGTTQFDLLGIRFSVDLDDMIPLNYARALERAKQLLHLWKLRPLTPFGRITVIKALILSKFVHLFTTMPSPGNDFIKELSNIIFSYLWQNKPDKIKRTIVCQDYKQGGLKMIDIKCYIQSLKLCWVERLFSSTKSCWKYVFEETISPIYKIAKFGTGWCKHISTVVSNKFWIEILQTWTTFSDKLQTCKSEIDVLSTPIWYNTSISKQNLFFPKWFKNGIEYVGDVVDSNMNFIDSNCLEQKYHIKSSNFLEIHRLKLLVTKFIASCNSKNPAIFQRPVISPYLRFVLSNKKRARGYYQILLDKSLDVSVRLNEKWKNDLQSELTENDWSIIFTISLRVVSDNDMAWFQYRIIHRILGTQSLLFKMSIKDSENCLLCDNSPETLVHIFCKCPKVLQLWRDLEHWICMKTKIALKLRDHEILLGYLKPDYNVPINALILQTKSFIFSSSRKYSNLSFSKLKLKLKTLYDNQYSLAKLNFSEHCFDKNWAIFKIMFYE